MTFSAHPQKEKFNFEPTGIGSVPFKDPKAACQTVFKYFREIPFWPQLPKRSFLENMYAQFSEGMPGLMLEEGKKAIYIDRARAEREMETAYTKCLDEDVDFFKISEDRAKGFYEFLNTADKKTGFVKGQITGPISFGLFLTDQDKRSIVYDADLFEILTRVLSMKARWQIRLLRKVSSRVIIFIDEPYLVSIGSSFINVDIEDAVKKLDGVIESIRKEGALVGIHCCGNTDWSMLLKRPVDILNFDAYNFMKEFLLYYGDLKVFLKNGGTIAWGIVPTSGSVNGEDAKRLCGRIRESIRILEDKGLDGKSIPSLITPSCGAGTLDEKKAKDIFKLTEAVSEELRAAS